MSFSLISSQMILHRKVVTTSTPKSINTQPSSIWAPIRDWQHSVQTTRSTLNTRKPSLEEELTSEKHEKHYPYTCEISQGNFAAFLCSTQFFRALNSIRILPCTHTNTIVRATELSSPVSLQYTLEHISHRYYTKTVVCKLARTFVLELHDHTSTQLLHHATIDIINNVTGIGNGSIFEF